MMSNPFLNQVLYGVGNAQVNADYLEGLKRYMYTADRVIPLAEMAVYSPSVPEVQPDKVAPLPCPEVAKPVSPEPQRITSTPKNTLFWCLFLAVYEYPEYMEALRRSGNREIEEKLRMVECLKKTPKILKESSAKLTMEQTQALYGSLLTVREDRLEFCAAYAAFYQKPIFILYPKTYRAFFPTTDAVFGEGAIVLWASPGPKHTFLYSLDTESNVHDRVAERTTLLKAQSNYKTGELVQLANQMGIVLPPKAKKQEVYDALRIAIHKDMHFET